MKIEEGLSRWNNEEIERGSETRRKEILKRWTIEGHEVALVRMEVRQNVDDDYLVCECDFAYEIKNGQKFKVGGSSNECARAKAVREQVKLESKSRYGEHWKNIGPKNAISDIWERTEKLEWLGQHYATLIYVQEVAELLEISVADCLHYCDELFAEEKLDLNGMILIPYKKRFRFPKEIQMLLRYIIEEPLGWPNGEAGDGFVYRLEHAIHENTDYKSGKTVFGEESYPHIPQHILAMFGLIWVRDAILSARDPKALLHIITRLEHWTREARAKLSKQN